MFKNFARVGFGLSLAVLATVSQAAVDVTAVVTEISGAAAPVALIGGGVLVLMVGIKVYKWVRAAM